MLLNKESKSPSSFFLPLSYRNDRYQQQSNLHWLFMLTDHSNFVGKMYFVRIEGSLTLHFISSPQKGT